MPFARGDFRQYFLRIRVSLGEFHAFVDPVIRLEGRGSFLAVLGQLSVPIQINGQHSMRFIRLVGRNLLVPESVQVPAMLVVEVVSTMIAGAESVRRI